MIINRVNRKRYVGSGVVIEERHKVHLSDLSKGKHDNPHLQHAFDKYGRESFGFKVLELTSENQKQRLSREQHYIDYYIDEFGRNYLYNIALTAGGGCGPHSKKTKECLRVLMEGVLKSEEHKIEMSKSKKRFYKTLKGKEARKRQSEMLHGKQYAKGHIQTAETRKKISEIVKNRYKSGEEKEKTSIATIAGIKSRRERAA